MRRHLLLGFMVLHAPALATPAEQVDRSPSPALRAQAGRTADKLHFIKGLDPAGDNWLALKAGPKPTSERIAKLGPDTLLRVLASQGAWSKVRTEAGQEGWVAARYLACCRASQAQAAPQAPLKAEA